MIRLEQASRTFGAVHAVRDVSFALEPGQLTGFLGPNGAGKTTTMRLMTGILAPTSGRVLLDGQDLAVAGPAGRARMGYLPENTPLYPDMTVLEFLETAGKMRGMRGAALRAAVGRVVTSCGLRDRLSQLIAHLSKGYKQRVGLAQAMIHQPQLLILDEPTTGLDPNQVSEMKQLISELGRRQTVLLSTHLLHQVPELCDRVLIIHEGRLIFDGTPQTMIGHAGTPTEVLLLVDGVLPALDALRATCPFLHTLELKGSTSEGFQQIRCTGQFDDPACAALSQALHQQGCRVAHLSPETASFAAVFAEMTGTRESACS